MIDSPRARLVRGLGQAAAPPRRRRGGCAPGRRGGAVQQGEEDAKLAQKLGQLQPFLAVFQLECVGQLASFGPT